MSGPALIVDAVRSPMGRGREGGSLSGLHAVELLSQVISQLISRAGIDPGLVEDVIVGCVSQAGEQSGCPGRLAWLACGFPDHVPATTIDRRCGSSQQAAHFGAQAIAAGANDVVVVAGLESMSRVPMFSARSGGDPWGPSVTERYAPGLIHQGVSAELVAARWGITREEMDDYAARSHQLASAAAAAGHFDQELVPVRVGGTDADPEIVTHDETIRPGTTVEGLRALPPVFQDAEQEDRFPEITWSVTAGNSSQLADGAAAVLLVSDRFARAHGLRALARFVDFAVTASDPVVMLEAPIPATQKILQRSGVTMDEITHFEVNEAFASVPLAWGRAMKADEQRLNPLGGAIALGHPLGASGARLLTTMVHSLARAGGRYGLQTMCEGSGMANATLVERIGS